MIDYMDVQPIPINYAQVYQQSNSQLIHKNIPGYRGTIDRWYPLMSIKINNIDMNEIIMVVSSVEATNDTGRNYSIVSRIVVNDNYNDMPGNNGAFGIGGGGGGNVDNQRHHERLSKTAVWIPKQSYEYKCITVMGRAVSSAGKPGDMINFTQAAADLTVMRFK